MSATEASIIELEDVEVSFTSRTGSPSKSNKVHAVCSINLLVLHGQTLGLVSESGCDKSATVNIMCGLVAPTTGEVYFNGEEAMKHTVQARCRIGRAVSVVFQDPATALNPCMVVCDQFVDPIRVHKIGVEEECQKRVMELISMVGLPSPAFETLPGQLSDGQHQRVAIARVLLLNPDMITADEPTSALDVFVRTQVLDLLIDLKRGLNLAMAFISHDIQTVRYILDCIAVTNKGPVVKEGPARQLLEDPKDPYTRILFGVVPSLLYPALEGK